MNWVRDCDERLVNIDNWDFLDFQTISDKTTDLPVALKFYLRRHNEEHTLGYKSSKNNDGEEIIEHISKGVGIHLETLESVLYHYMDEEFDKELGNMPLGEGFAAAHDERYGKIRNMIGKRFVED